MTRLRLRFIVRFLLAVLLFVAIAFAAVVATRESRINRSTYNRIVIGMADAEVDQVLQQSPVDLAPLNLHDVAYDESMENLLTRYPTPHTIKSWQGDRYLISVCLDKNGRVASKYFKRTPNPSLLDRIADWFGI